MLRQVVGCRTETTDTSVHSSLFSSTRLGWTSHGFCCQSSI